MSASSEMHREVHRAAGPLAAALLLTITATAQAPRGPELHAAFAGSAHRGATPALVWLCEQFLPSLAAWPEQLDPADSFSLSLTARGVSIGETAVVVPDGAAAIGMCRLDTASDGSPPLLWRCDADGLEEWHIPHDFELPHRWHGLLHSIEADVLDTPRTLAVPVVAGHLAGALLDGDPRSTALRLGPALCGEATWIAWSSADHVRVRGRSNGGLMLPMALLAIAAIDGSGKPTSLSLRAFAARDADRAEAARQLGRDDREADIETLRSLLRAEDMVRLTAIDALVRHGASDELPNIVAAADGTMPWATIAAGDALQTLWADASPSVRQATRAALHRSQSIALRSIDVEELTTSRSVAAKTAAADPAERARLLLLLLCSAIGLLGLWTRERLRQAPAAS